MVIEGKLNVKSFDDFLAELLKDPEFKEAYIKAKNRLDLIYNSTKSGKRAWLLDQISQVAEHIELSYLMKLPMRKLYRVARQYKVEIEVE